MSNANFVDLSVFQPEQIDWQAYKRWSASGDGISRVALRSSYGTGFTDQHYAIYRKGAQNAGIDVILHYHYCYPQLNGASAEANWQSQVVGEIRANDLVVMDFEEGVPQANAAWALAWLEQQERNYGGKLPGIYASDNYIRTRLQDNRLAKYPLWLANWQFNPDARPGCPPPWKTYAFLQYTDKATNIPGIAGTVDANVSLVKGSSSMAVPQGWTDDGTTLTAPNGIKIVFGFRRYVLDNNWDPENWPIELEHGQNPLELSNPDLGDGNQQLFRECMLGYKSNRGVFVEWIGVELQKYRQMHADDQKTVSALTQQLAAEKASEDTLHTQITQLTQQLADEKATESELQAKISALQDQLANSTPVDKQAVSALLQALQPYVALAEQLKKVA